MGNYQAEIEEAIIAELGNVMRETAEKAVFGAFKLNKPEENLFGDYTTNAVMQNFSALSPEEKNRWKNPRGWAEAIGDGMKQKSSLAPVVAKIEVAGGGFINFYLTTRVKVLILQDYLENKLVPDQDQSVYLVEFSSPNIAKPFTVGHLRSTIIGAAIANLLEARGKKVIRDNHLGDWGTQFGKQVVAIEKWGNWAEIEQSETPVKILVDLYVKFHDEAEKDPSLEDQARETFVKMEQGEDEYLRWWQKVVDLSMKEFNRIYDELGVKFDENEGKGFGESAVRGQMGVVVAELRRKGMLKSSQGAEIVEFPAETKLPPQMILKKDGSTLYVTRDLATDKRRREQYGSNLVIINEAGREQSLYFRQLFQLEEMLGWFEPGRRIHVGHGLYRFRDRKMSTRKGDVIWLEDVKRAAKAKVKEMSKTALNQVDLDKIAWGAIKWNDLSREAMNDIDFDLETMISLKGNSGPYMQYTVVRIQSVWQKCAPQDQGKLIKDLIDRVKIAKEAKKTLRLENLGLPEQKLIDWCNEYEKSLKRAAEERAPHILANYLFALAQGFNNYYNEQEILGQPARETLTKAVGMVLVDGLDILGLQIPSKM